MAIHPASNAGVTVDQAIHLDDHELDTDDGLLVREIEIDAGGLEYEYDVDAHTGTILEFEIDD